MGARVLALGVAVVSALLFSGPHDVAFWADSVSYFSAADSVQRGAFVQYEGLPLTLFPPVYPIAIAAVSLTGLDRQPTAFALNLLCVSLIAMKVSGISRRHDAALLAVSTLVVAALCVGPIPSRLRYAASELPFMALTLTCLDQADRRIWRRGPVWAFALGLLCSLAFLTRYSGVVVMAVVGCAMALDPRRASTRLAELLWFSGGALPLSVAWLCRNRLADGTWMGPRPEAASTVSEAFTGTASTLVEWLMPGALWANTPLEWLVSCGSAAAAVGASVVVTQSAPPDVKRTVRVHATFAVSYVAFIVVSSLFTAVDVINDRLLAPAYVSALLAFGVSCVWLGRASGMSDGLGRRLWGMVLAGAVTLGLLQAHRRVPPEIDYMQERWRASPTTAAARRLTPGDLCFSNVPEPVYLHTGRQCARALMTLYRTDERVPDRLLSHLQSADPRRLFYVRYYKGLPGERMIGDPRTLLAPYLVRRVPTADGEVYELRTPR
jgi:hypothetical protein